MQYLVNLGRMLWEWRQNPQCSVDCCLSLVLTLQDIGSTATTDQQPELNQGTFEESFDMSELGEADDKVEEEGAAKRKDAIKRGHVNRNSSALT